MDFRKRFPLRLWRPDVGDEVDAELEFHLAMRQRELMAQGMTEAQARRAALDRFGDYRRARRECRAIGFQRERRMRLFQYISELRQDAAFSVRQMLAAPGFTLVAVATLALGIGATTAIFSAVHAVVLRPLPLADPDALVMVQSGWREGRMSVAPSHYLHMAEEQTAFAAVAAVAWANFTLAREDGAERVVGARATGQYFDVLGVPPALGGVFGDAHDAPGRGDVVVLSHRLWTRLFGADPSIVGRQIPVNQRPHTVLGVMPPALDFADTSEELWVPMAFTAEERERRGNHYLAVYGRLRDGVSVRQADEQMNLMIARRLERWPDESPERTMHATSLMEVYVGSYPERLFVLFQAVGLVLLIACGNVSNLLLARGATRARELALRSALGAGQGRLVRQLFTESLVLGALAAAAGIALAYGFITLILAFGPPAVPRLDQTRIDGVVLLFAVLLALASSLVFGLLPAWRASRTDVNAALKDGGRGAGARGGRDLVRSALVTAEVALALVLLVGAGLLIRSAIELQRVDLGFDPRGVFTGRVLISEAKYGTPAARLGISQEIEQALAAIPGVTTAALASRVPGTPGFSNGLTPEGVEPTLANITQSDGFMITPGYFTAMRLPIVRGRAFTDADRDGSQQVVILNETAARRMWPGEDALGKRLTGSLPTPGTVVGIAADVRAGGMAAPVLPAFYIPLAQLDAEAWGWAPTLYVVARTAGDPAAIGPTARRAIAATDPGIPLFAVQTMEDRMAQTIETERFNTLLMALLGAVGLVLAAVGIYGVIAYFAAQRTSEIGIRLALGATRAHVVGLIVRQAAVPVAAGVALGAVGAVYASHTLAAQLVNVQATDPATFAVVAACLSIVALAAAWVPARRAARLDPTRALQA
jgi:putative ABC transport system permease protein